MNTIDIIAIGKALGDNNRLQIIQVLSERGNDYGGKEKSSIYLCT